MAPGLGWAGPLPGGPQGRGGGLGDKGSVSLVNTQWDVGDSGLISKTGSSRWRGWMFSPATGAAPPVSVMRSLGETRNPNPGPPITWRQQG